MDDRPAPCRTRPLRVRLPDDAFNKLVELATQDERPIDRQAAWLLRRAIEDMPVPALEPSR